MLEVSQWIKKIWHDPVWSTVIASVIFFFIIAAIEVLFKKDQIQVSEKVSTSSPISKTVSTFSAVPPKLNSKFRIAITEFQPVSDIEISEAKQLKDRIVESINNRKQKRGVEIEVINVNEVIDPLSVEGDIRVNKLGKEVNAQIVICGKLRHDEEYYFRPFIYNFITDKTMSEKIQVPSLKIGPDVNHARKVILKEQKINNMIDFMSYIGAIAHYESKDYYLSAQIMRGIESPSADHYFFIASALYLATIKSDPTYTAEESAKLDEVIQQLDRAIKLNPDFEEAWFDKGYVQHQSGNLRAALFSTEKAISLNPYFHDAWVEKSLILYDLGKRNEAIKALHRAEKIRKEQSDTTRSLSDFPD